MEPSDILFIYTFILVDRTQWAYRMQNHVLPTDGEHYIYENSIKCFWCTTLRARIPLRYTCVKQVAFAEFICPKCAILFLSSIQSQSETHFVCVLQKQLFQKCHFTGNELEVDTAALSLPVSIAGGLWPPRTPLLPGYRVHIIWELWNDNNRKVQCERWSPSTTALLSSKHRLQV